ncbi:MAG: energy transducer TonB [Ignavibacteriales bacterium]|nr:energy transducer TonB [Ignavibacteriales bacterium]
MMSKDLRKGWTASIAVHAVVLIILMMIQVPTMARKSEFVEIVWGALGSTGTTKADPQVEQKQMIANKPIKAQTAAKPIKRASQPVILPERKLASLNEEPLPASPAKKLESFEQRSTGQKIESAAVDNREQRLAARRETEREIPGGGIGSGVGGVRPDGSDVEGSDVDRDVGFSIQWPEGGTRRKLSGTLPHYPDGVNLEAQIKIRTVVAPDGDVKIVQPAQKADTRLENAAMKEIRFWKFEPLKPDQPQVDQTCVITFLFKLK